MAKKESKTKKPTKKVAPPTQTFEETSENPEIDEDSEGGSVGFTFEPSAAPSSIAEQLSDDNELSLKDGFDIFSVGCEILPKREGVYPKFYIKKNGDYLVTKGMGYSIEKLQKEYGGGQYHIYCKRPNGTIFKHQNIPIAGPEKEDGFNDIGVVAQPESSNSKEPSFMEMLAYMKSQEAAIETKTRLAEEKARESARESMMGNNQLVSTLLTAMMNNSQAQQQASQQMMQLFMTLSEKQQASTNMLIEKMNEKLEKSKEKSFDPLDLLKIAQNAEDRGYKMHSELMKLAKDQAEAIADARAENEPKEESLMTTVMKGFMPLVAKAVETSAANPARPAQDPLLAQRQREWEAHQRQTQLDSERNKREQAIANEKVRAAKAAESGRRTADGGQKTNGTVVTPSQNPEPIKVNDKVAADMREALKQHVGGLAFGVIANDMDKKIDPKVSAQKTVELLKNDGIKVQDALVVFPLSDIMNMANQYGLDEVQKTWLTDYHKWLSSFAVVKPPVEVVKNVDSKNQASVEPVKSPEVNVGASV